MTYDTYKISWTDKETGKKKVSEELIDSSLKGRDAITDQLRLELSAAECMMVTDIIIHSIKKIK